MKSTDIIQPTAITQPVAVNGSRNSIPESPAGSNYASIEEGFPDVTMISPTNGGLPPFGQDFNGLFYLSTDQKVYLQNGGVITYNEDVASAIGGYPKGAILDYVTSNGTCAKVQSLINDNSNNFVETPSLIDGVNWQLLNYSGALNHSQLTNCILQAPKPPDLSLTDGVLTLASGAEVIVPYGTSAPELSIGDSLNGGTIVDISWDESKLFYIVQYDEDKTDEVINGFANLYLFLGTGASLFEFPSSYTTSGTTAPTAFVNNSAVWYDTNENYVKTTSDNGSNWTGGASFPIGRASSSTGSGYTKILQIFQASGFIDKTIWLNKGVTFLMPNGRNDDGTLKNIEYTTAQIYTDSLTSSTYNNYTYAFTLNHTVDDVYYPVVGDVYYYEQSSQPNSGTNCLWYNPETNLFMAYRENAGWFEETAAVFAVVGYDTTNQCFLPGALKNTFHAADYNDTDGKWIYKQQTLFTETTFAESAITTYDLSDYLPDDGKVYECLFNSYIRTGTTSGNAAGGAINSDIIDTHIQLCWCVTRSASNAVAGGSAILPVGPGRYVGWYNKGGSGTSGNCTLEVCGYRRVK